MEGTEGNYDHVVLIRMTAEGPQIAHLLLDGLLDEYDRVSDTDAGWRKRAD